MIFALIDYLNYRKRRGRYSHDKLLAFGLRLATPENFPAFERIPFGHVLFASTSNSALSWVIMYFTDSTLSHTALIYGNGLVHDRTTSGVMRHSFANYLDGVSYLAIQPPPEGTDLSAMKPFVDSTLGHGYNWAGVYRLAFHLLIGDHHSFSWRIAADASLLFALAGIAGYLLNPVFGRIALCTGAVYLIVVLANRVRFRFIGRA